MSINTNGAMYDQSHHVDGFITCANVSGQLVLLFNYTYVKSSFTCVTHIEIRANSVATKLFEAGRANKNESARLHVLETLNAHLAEARDIKPIPSGSSEYIEQMVINGSSQGEIYSVIISVRSFGEDLGQDIPAGVAGLINSTCESMSAALRCSLT